MNRLIPKITIDGKEVTFLDGALTNTGGLRAASMDFKIPLRYGNEMKLWNKEVVMYMNEDSGTPVFRGYVKRIKKGFDFIRIMAQDVLGYLVLGGSPDQAILALTDDDNLDGLTAGNAIRKAIKMVKLDSKIGTDCIGDTSPLISSSAPPIRGTLAVIDIIKKLLERAVDDSGELPRPNILKVIDDGKKSQLVIELESDLKNDDIVYKFNSKDNILDLKIVNRKTPTVVVVTGKNKVKGTYTHEGAREALDVSYLEVENKNLESPAACKDFAQKIFRANLETQYEYGINTLEGIYLTENDVINISTDQQEYSGNYRIRGKKIAFTPGGYSVGININKKPPTLAEYIKQQDS